MAGKKSSGGSSSNKGNGSGRSTEKKQPKGPITGSGQKKPPKPKPSTGDLGPNKK